MSTEYRKFYLVPGQQAPIPGSTGYSVEDGGIVWAGEKDNFPTEIASQSMTEDEIARYEARNRLHLSRLDFQRRFTFDELVAIEVAAETNPAVRVLQRQQMAAEFIDVKDEATILGIMYLVSVKLISYDRALKILSY